MRHNAVYTETNVSHLWCSNWERANLRWLWLSFIPSGTRTLIYALGVYMLVLYRGAACLNPVKLRDSILRLMPAELHPIRHAKIFSAILRKLVLTNCVSCMQSDILRWAASWASSQFARLLTQGMFTLCFGFLELQAPYLYLERNLALAVFEPVRKKMNKI